MGSNDEAGVVRVELENASSLEAPMVATAPSGEPSWTIGLVVLLVAAAAVLLIALSPEQTETPEKTARAEVVDEAIDVIDAPGEQIEEAGPPGIAPLDIDGSFDDIFAYKDGFVGRIAGVEAAAPRVLRSVDGIEWTEVATTVDRIEVEFDTPLNPSTLPSEVGMWRSVASIGSNLVMSSTTQQTVDITRSYFVSEDGATWSQLDNIGSTANNPAPMIPLIFDETSFLGLQIAPTEAFASLFADHTTIVTPTDGICGVTASGPASEQRFQLVSCGGNDLGLLDAASVVGAVPADTVLECLRFLQANVLNSSPRIVRQALGADAQPQVLAEGAEGRVVALTSPHGLRNGGLVALDFGPIGSEQSNICDGVVEQDTALTPAFVVVDPTTSRVSRWGVPGGVALREREIPSIHDLVTLFDGRTLLVAEFADQLWMLDVETGEWLDIVTPVGTPFTRSFGETIAISESGARIYRVSGSQLTAFDVSQTETGLLFAKVSTMPINLGEFIDRVEVIYADDQVLFVTDGNSVWNIDAQGSG